MRFKKILILFQAFIIMITTFFAIYIPIMFGNFIFLKEMINHNVDVYSSLFVFCCIALGFIWFSLYVSGKVLYFFNDLYRWDKNLKVK